MQIAIQETLLAASNIHVLFEAAVELDVDGVEISGVELESRIEDIADASVWMGMQVAGIHFGRQGALLSPDLDERERALDRLRSNIACAVDLNAAGVIVVPHYGALVMPNLSPWMSAGELHAEMLHMHLRTLSDFCHALGTKLFIQTARQEETGFVTRLEQAGAVVKRIKHPDVKIAADLGCLHDEKIDAAAALRLYDKHLGYVSLASGDLSRVALASLIAALREVEYDGWITLTGTNEGALNERIANLRSRLR